MGALLEHHLVDFPDLNHNKIEGTDVMPSILS
ncbi:hypothetical protein HBHAL_2788 [Halobacillus halophilus DSM 2266]|uniref:Uncharacterized protein n=1 Tax=Halobacillus halophilus (strain ATCC 35676 / DSM 2266 / JCM 20832 / KCTC 3685 / LMG 17431 / NBRC 102448 / NCIMB 2269) TaxID=866895 RepID=I0JLW6_HALH3|nr:hypothetical protein HBHAL_2788 [Halobacillus halophilus DSM 2266]